MSDAIERAVASFGLNSVLVAILIGFLGLLWHGLKALAVKIVEAYQRQIEINDKISSALETKLDRKEFDSVRENLVTSEECLTQQRLCPTCNQIYQFVTDIKSVRENLENHSHSGLPPGTDVIFRGRKG